LLEKIQGELAEKADKHEVANQLMALREMIGNTVKEETPQLQQV